MAAGGVSHLWREWGIQSLVLLSFALQVLLLVFGGMRRCGLSTSLRVALWLAYLSADSTAIYTLGHLSITSGGSREHQLAAFWAPFLLLHLGGPYNVTAYALEDNRLWLRHLQTLVVQVLGAAYVLYKYMADSGTLLQLASISMFVAGIVKYGERTWALKRANDNKSSSGKAVGPYELLRQDMGDDEILLRAHSQFAICKSGFDDTKVVMRPKPPDEDSPRLFPFYDEDIFKLVEMELSLMYDTLYTKAAVIHTWYGFCIHSISLVGTSAALCLFRLRLSRGDHAYKRVDVAISYILLAGALVLEVISACRAVLSSWTCCFVLRKAEDYSGSTRAAWLEWLHYYVLSSLRKPLKPANRRLWRGTIGQYNMLHLCTRDRTGLGSKLAAKIGQEDWWNKLHFSGTFCGSDSLSMQQLKGLLFKMIRQDGFAKLVGPLSTMTTRGSFILEQKQAFKGVAKWTVLNIELDESIVIWHIATDLFIWESKAGHEVELIEVTRVLSNYMMFLLVAKPAMLPGRERRTVHLTPSRILETIWRVHILGDEDKSVRASPGSWNKCCVLKELFHHEGPNGSTITQAQREKLAETLFANWSYEGAQQLDSYPEVLEGSRDELYTCASNLAKQLLHLGRPDTLELIFSVWVEMMLYAADHCPRDSHARELSNGGEFITILWLLVQHWTYVYKNKIAC
ncbi:unnamed protein product [Triticum aestivum]|uniref:DUF4220 domain-containing protein n=2 Tax=Triticum aestivum TaxID=4565 RepID=A0A9R1JEP3_WHEAT|nr:uncharacterized protein LOC123051658 [Triticum aestivum]KAF7014214.1 hypothetical protein CFC21_028230 [Triticum aestivum]SPT16461.1 unnamed protein product [Triticum aestivum]